MLQKPPPSELKWLRFSAPRKHGSHGFFLPSRASFERVSPMSRWNTFAQTTSVLLLFLVGSSQAQEATPALSPGTWDFDVWIAGATGEETTNSFLQSQIFMAGFSFSKAISGEISRGWLRSRMDMARCDPDIYHVQQSEGSRPCLRSRHLPLEFQLPHGSACAATSKAQAEACSSTIYRRAIRLPSTSTPEAGVEFTSVCGNTARSTSVCSGRTPLTPTWARIIRSSMACS